MGTRRTSIWQLFLPSWMCTMFLLFLLWEDSDMNMTQWIALIVALVTVAGTLIAAFWQLKRDGKTIDGISSDTSHMKPQIDQIGKNTERVKDIVIERIQPAMASIEHSGSKIDFIAGEIEYQKRLKKDLSPEFQNRDRILAEIQAVYAKNAALNQQNIDFQNRNLNLMRQNEQLRAQISQLQAELQRERDIRQHEAPCEDWEP